MNRTIYITKHGFVRYIRVWMPNDPSPVDIRVLHPRKRSKCQHTWRRLYAPKLGWESACEHCGALNREFRH